MPSIESARYVRYISRETEGRRPRNFTCAVGFEVRNGKPRPWHCRDARAEEKVAGWRLGKAGSSCRVLFRRCLTAGRYWCQPDRKGIPPPHTLKRAHAEWAAAPSRAQTSCGNRPEHPATQISPAKPLDIKAFRAFLKFESQPVLVAMAGFISLAAVCRSHPSPTHRRRLPHTFRAGPRRSPLKSGRRGVRFARRTSTSV
jgi:hypothetical protein